MVFRAVGFFRGSLISRLFHHNNSSSLLTIPHDCQCDTYVYRIKISPLHGAWDAVCSIGHLLGNNTKFKWSTGRKGS